MASLLRNLTLSLALLGLPGACVSPYTSALSRGDALAEQNRWAEAQRAFQQALDQQPNSEEARTRLRVARWNHARTIAEQALLALEQRQTLRALRLARQAIDIDAAVPEAQNAFDQSSKAAIAEVEQLAQQRPVEALDLVLAVRKEIPENPRARDLEASLRERVAGLRYAEGETAVGRKLLGQALLSFSEAERVRPGFRDALGRAEALHQRLADELRFHLVVAPPATPSPLSLGLSQRVRAWAPSATTPLLTISEAPPPGASGARVSLDLGEVTRDQRVRSESRSCSYVCGIDRVPNPAHQAATLRVRDAERRLRDAEAEETRERQALQQARSAEETAAAEARSSDDLVERARKELARCEQGPKKPTRRADCEREGRQLRKAQEQAAQRRGAAEAARSGRGRAEGALREATERVKRDRRDWERQVSVLAATPALLEQERRCGHTFGVEIHRVSARVTQQWRVEALGSARVAAPGPKELVEVGEDETFAAERGRCPQLVAGDPLSLPANEEMDRRLLERAEREVRGQVEGWYRGQIQKFEEAQTRMASAGRPEESVEARVRARLLREGRWRGP